MRERRRARGAWRGDRHPRRSHGRRSGCCRHCLHVRADNAPGHAPRRPRAPGTWHRNGDEYGRTAGQPRSCRPSGHWGIRPGTGRVDGQRPRCARHRAFAGRLRRTGHGRDLANGPDRCDRGPRSERRTLGDQPGCAGIRDRDGKPTRGGQSGRERGSRRSGSWWRRKCRRDSRGAAQCGGGNLRQRPGTGTRRRARGSPRIGVQR